MMNILIADDEKIEREGIRYLLALERRAEDLRGGQRETGHADPAHRKY